MEVCGTHTNAIAKSGLANKYKDKGRVNFISGPGCPVCVSAQGDIDNIISLALKPGVTIATFGDMMRVPGRKMSLQEAAAKGAKVRLVYSPLDAVLLAKDNPSQKVVFLAVGFETTAPLIAAAVLQAEKLKLKNFFVYCCLKTIPPALKKILAADNKIDGFLLPGNVCVVTGYKIFNFIAAKYKKPAAVAGFSAAEIIKAVDILLAAKKPAIKNAYAWASLGGNKEAQKLMGKVFKPSGGLWRGFGKINKSALELRPAYKNFDAKKTFSLPPVKDFKTACRCGLILQGKIKPPQCPFFAKTCTPLKPLGPCMVSVEGACAAYHKNL